MVLEAPGSFIAPVANLDAQKAKFLKSANLVPETGADGDALASLSPAARQHLGSALSLHAGAEPVFFRALPPVGLKCTFRHEKSLLPD